MDIIKVNELTIVVPVPVNDLDEIRAEMAREPVFEKIMEYICDARLARQQEQGQQRSAALLDPLCADGS